MKLLNRVHEAHFSNHGGQELKKRTGVALDAPQQTPVQLGRREKTGDEQPLWSNSNKQKGRQICSNVSIG